MPQSDGDTQDEKHQADVARYLSSISIRSAKAPFGRILLFVGKGTACTFMLVGW